MQFEFILLGERRLPTHPQRIKKNKQHARYPKKLLTPKTPKLRHWNVGAKLRGGQVFASEVGPPLPVAVAFCSRRLPAKMRVSLLTKTAPARPV